MTHCMLAMFIWIRVASAISVCDQMWSTHPTDVCCCSLAPLLTCRTAAGKLVARVTACWEQWSSTVLAVHCPLSWFLRIKGFLSVFAFSGVQAHWLQRENHRTDVKHLKPQTACLHIHLKNTKLLCLPQGYSDKDIQQPSLQVTCYILAGASARGSMAWWQYLGWVGSTTAVLKTNVLMFASHVRAIEAILHVYPHPSSSSSKPNQTTSSLDPLLLRSTLLWMLP